MPTITLWLLIASGTGPPVVIERFAKEQACASAGAQIEARSDAKRNMVAIRTICVPVQK